MVGSLSSNSCNQQMKKGGKFSSANCSGSKFFVLCLLALLIQHSTFPPLRLLKKLEVGNECFSLSFPLPSTQQISFMPQPRSPAPVFPANNCPWKCQYFNLSIAVSHYFLAHLVLTFPPDFPKLLLYLLRVSQGTGK